jgi:hypothetical protein
MKKVDRPVSIMRKLCIATSLLSGQTGSWLLYWTVTMETAMCNNFSLTTKRSFRQMLDFVYNEQVLTANDVIQLCVCCGRGAQTLATMSVGVDIATAGSRACGRRGWFRGSNAYYVYVDCTWVD